MNQWPTLVDPAPQPAAPDHQTLIENARAQARQRFKERLDNGLPVAGCECESTDASEGPTAQVAGVRFLDSGQTYFFDPVEFELTTGDWVVVETNRGLEAAKVVISPSQMLQASLTGTPQAGDQGARRRRRSSGCKQLKRDAAQAVKTFGAKIRERNLPMKPISAEYNYDGSHT